jgi:hypothetical protein
MSSSNKSKSKAGALARVQALIAGTHKHLSAGSFTLGGTTYTAATFVPLLQRVADAIQAVNDLQASTRDAVAAMHVTEVQLGLILQLYQRYVAVTFAHSTPTLADFGLSPPKTRTPLSVEKLAARTAKAAATRKARGTTSKKQKLSIKGNVSGVLVTPVTAAAAAPTTEPSAQPALTAPSTPAPGTATK